MDRHLFECGHRAATRKKNLTFGLNDDGYLLSFTPLTEIPPLSLTMLPCVASSNHFSSGSRDVWSFAKPWFSSEYLESLSIVLRNEYILWCGASITNWAPGQRSRSHDVAVTQLESVPKKRINDGSWILCNKIVNWLKCTNNIVIWTW